MKLRDDIYVCVWHTHERKGACMYCYRTNGSLIKTQDQVPHILEGLDHTMWPQDQRVDLAPALFKSTGAASKTVLQFRSIYHSRATCALLELVKFIIHIHFTDGICWLLWNNNVINRYFVWELFCSEKHQLAPRWYSLRRGAAGWSWVSLCLWEKYSQKFLIKGICCSEICLFCLFYCSENCSEFVLKKHTGHQTRHTYRQYLSWFQMGVIFFPL